MNKRTSLDKAIAAFYHQEHVLDLLVRIQPFLSDKDVGLFNRSLLNPCRTKLRNAEKAVVFWSDPVAVQKWKDNRA